MANRVKNSEDVLILLIALCISVIFFVLGQILEENLKFYKNEYWVVSLILNLCSYSVIAFNGWAIYKFVDYTRYIEKYGGNGLFPIINACFYGQSASIDLHTNGKGKIFFQCQ